MTRDAPVALVTTYYAPIVGGVETSAAGLARFLADRGHPVHVFTKRPSLDVPEQESAGGVTIHRLPPVGPRRASGKWRVLPSLTRALTQHSPRPALIYCVDYRGVGLAALRAARQVTVPVVFQAGTDGLLGASRHVDATRSAITRAAHAVARSPLRAAYTRADLYVCISRDIERETLDAGVPRDRVLYLPHPVHTADFAPISPTARATLRAALGLPASGAIVVSVGRLSREKGTLDLVEAWRALAPVAAHLVLIGPDEPGHPWDAGAPARAIARDAGPGAAITFAGAQSPERVAAFLRVADVAVQPAHFEAFGIAALEAMAAGVPVVASNVGGLKDFVEPNVNGLLVPPHTPAALVEALRRLLDDAALCQRLAVGAQATAARFDESIILTQLAETLETLEVRR